MSCCKKKFCVREINQLCWKLGLSIDQAVKINGEVYLFVITDGDQKIPFRYGIDARAFLIEKAKKANLVG